MLSPVIAAFAALVFVAACGPAPVTTQPSEPPAAIDPAGPWELESGTLADQPLALVAGAPITLVVEGSQVSGRSACNQYFGEFAITLRLACGRRMAASCIKASIWGLVRGVN